MGLLLESACNGGGQAGARVSARNETARRWRYPAQRIDLREPAGYEPIYNVTKAALVMFSKNLANEVVRDNIRVNTVNPGLVLTPDWIKTAKELTADSGGDWEAHLQSVADEYAPIRRFASAAEIANLFVFLCSDRASYCVGSTFFADGGMLRTI
jgi:NAD(P)-dependent dehydrogenase (short-subunit alcohol dehydrogenase family)